MAKPLVTVVIPSWNGHDLLARSLPSVLQQEKIDYKILVIDNGSSEQVTGSKLRSWLVRLISFRCTKDDALFERKTLSRFRKRSCSIGKTAPLLVLLSPKPFASSMLKRSKTGLAR